MLFYYHNSVFKVGYIRKSQFEEKRDVTNFKFLYQFNIEE